jgi:quercetin 2,3-dioxygenase
MFIHYPFETLGHADHGWLKARHHFSFSRYYNPRRTGFGALLVINDDTVAPGRGFAPHPHDNMEIITYVRSGAITHKDSMENHGRTEAGDVQVMSAGTGVFHSEVNAESVDTTLFQIWIRPDKRDVQPRWDAQQFPKEPVRDALKLLVSGRAEDAGKGALFIHQDAAIYAGRLSAGTQLTQQVKHQAYVVMSSGSATVNDVLMRKGDGAELVGEKTITIHAQDDTEILVIDVPDYAKA